jgi:hypothetical protein
MLVKATMQEKLSVFCLADHKQLEFAVADQRAIFTLMQETLTGFIKNT